ncbi:MAG TPA: SIMPL domain-containing protein [Vicinamibacterales bacterium]|nr:SIMPL domain-containing protein [Vicinamibacterales bacterium]
MSRLTTIFAMIAALGVSAGARAEAPQTQDTAPNGVIVTQGEATLTVAPDRAYIQMAAEGRAQKAGEAQRLAADAMTALQTSLKNAGVPADAIRTTGYTLTPENDYVNGRQQFRDFLARNQIEVRVDDLSKLSAIIDSTGTSGAASVSGLRFDVKNRSTVEQAALKQAVADAMSRASVIASGANHTVGNIVRIQEQRISQPSPVRYTMDSLGGRGGAGGGPTPVEPGQIEVRAQVTLTVAIK